MIRLRLIVNDEGLSKEDHDYLESLRIRLSGKIEVAIGRLDTIVVRYSDAVRNTRRDA